MEQPHSTSHATNMDIMTMETTIRVSYSTMERSKTSWNNQWTIGVIISFQLSKFGLHVCSLWNAYSTIPVSKSKICKFQEKIKETQTKKM